MQLELRQAGDALTSKNHELQQLHRDNGRLLEQHTTHERDLAGLRRDLHAATDRATAVDSELAMLRDVARQNIAIALQRDQAVEQLGRADSALQQEAESHRLVAAERDRLQGRLQALEEIVKRLDQKPPKKGGRQDALPFDDPPSTA